MLAQYNVEILRIFRILRRVNEKIIQKSNRPRKRLNDIRRQLSDVGIKIERSVPGDRATINNPTEIVVSLRSRRVDLSHRCKVRVPKKREERR